jgi:hypothetical protein
MTDIVKNYLRENLNMIVKEVKGLIRQKSFLQ